MKDTLGYGYYALNDCRIIPMSDAPIEESIFALPY